MSRSVLPLLMCAVVISATDPAAAQTRQTDLRGATLEELMAIEVTSVSRHEQRVDDVPAAVYVITQDDIHRSGMTSIPDLLRLVPGVQVAQINSNKWAVSVRGFNSIYSNKLLVMVDGRSLYNPAFSTVLWDTEDLVVDDIDRIEVVRGAGGAMWGANAVNGVINIITKGAGATRGVLARVSGGTFDTAAAAFRYGGAFGRVNYRIFAQGSERGATIMPAEALSSSDRWRTMTTGMRADWARGVHGFMLQASGTRGQQRPLWFSLDAAPPASPDIANDAVSETHVGTVLGRWTLSGPNGSSFQLQGYVDAAGREEIIGTYDRRTWDVDAQYHEHLGRHDLVAGGGYRRIAETLDGRSGYTFTPNTVRPIIVNGFAQDAIAFVDARLELTVGAKFENNTFAGSGLQPSARLLWKPTPQQRFWTSAARALRTPSLIDRGLRIEYPPIPQPDGSWLAVTALGSPQFESEHLFDTEAGYRLNIGSRASLDVVGFSGRYDHLQTLEPQAPLVSLSAQSLPIVHIANVYDNRLRADTVGAEITARVQQSPSWQFDGTFSAFHVTPHPALDSLDPASQTFDGNAPSSQWRAHIALPVSRRGQADVHVFRVGSLGVLNVPSYTRLDGRIEWRLTGRLAAAATGQNLLQHSHPEFYGDNSNIQSTLMPRSGQLQLTWRF